MAIRLDSEGKTLKDLRQIQEEVGRWAREQFGEGVSKRTGYPMDSQNSLTGMVEEIGELNHVTICYHQGRRGYDPSTEEGQTKYQKDRNDAVADLMIFLCDYACREGFDLLRVLNETWTNIVSKRTTESRESWEKHTHDDLEETLILPLDNIHKLPTSGVEAFVRLALGNGWKLTDGSSEYRRMIYRGDESDNWAAEWKRYVLPSGLEVDVPHWLARRLYELKMIPPNFVFDVEVVTVPATIETTRQTTIQEVLQQNGQGFAEPPDEKPVYARDADYPNWCSACGKVPVHKSSTSGTCPDCTQQARRRRGEI